MKPHNCKAGAVVKYTILSLLGLLLYSYAAEYASRWRGYFAVGGEFFILFLPLFYYIISKSVRDTIEEGKNDWDNWHDDDED